MTISNDPDEIRADIQRTRATLSNDVDELTESVKPQSVARRQVDKVKDAVGSVKDRMMGSDEDDYSSSTGDKASAAQEAVTNRAYAAKDTVTNSTYAAREAVKEAPTAVKRKTQGNPLGAGVVAFGLGMLVSSLIPSSQKERQAVSQLQDNLEPVKEKASQAGKSEACGTRGSRVG